MAWRCLTKDAGAVHAGSDDERNGGLTEIPRRWAMSQRQRLPRKLSRDHPIKFSAKAQFIQNLPKLQTELKRENPRY